MDKQQEQKVLSTLYDRLFDAITYAPQGESSVFDQKTTFIQLAKNMAINPADFANPATPVNPNGSLATAEVFSNMVDVIPALAADYQSTGNRLSQVYKNIVDGANSSVKTDPEQEKIYEQAFNYLNTTTTIKDFTGKEVTQTGPSSIYSAYNNNQTAYLTALTGYRNAYLGYDLSDPKQQREWQANEPLLRNAVTQAYNTWQAQGAAMVQQALAALASSVNSSVRNAIQQAQQAMANQQLASNVTGGAPWWLCYALPTDWYSESATQNFTELTLKSSYLNKTASSSFTSYGGGASWGGGLWSVGGDVSGSSKETQSHMQANNFELSAKIGTVRIMRGWLHEFLFRMNDWWIDSRPKDGISNGLLEGNADNLLPLIPTAFVVARDISITADFSTEDQKTIEKSVSGSTSVGWGPFQISGHYSHSSSSSSFNSTFNGGTINVPGIQIIGWVNEITPASAPLSKP